MVEFLSRWHCYQELRGIGADTVFRIDPLLNMFSKMIKIAIRQRLLDKTKDWALVQNVALLS